MLNLTRRIDETIVLRWGGQMITITLCQIRGNQAKLGIKAPPEVIIDREEIDQRKIKEGRYGSGNR